VKADLAGHDKPSEISKGYILIFKRKKKGVLTRICEVATPEMFEGNKKRYLDSRIIVTNMTSTFTL